MRKRRLGLFGHVARLRSDVPANQILRICTKTRDGNRPLQEWRRASGRPPTTWIQQICRDTGVTATEALQLAEDRPFWRTIATSGGFGWSLRVTTTTTIYDSPEGSTYRSAITRFKELLRSLLYSSRASIS